MADVFDALTHARPYKPAGPVSDAVAAITAGSGTQVDPAVVEAFAGLSHHRLAEVAPPARLRGARRLPRAVRRRMSRARGPTRRDPLSAARTG